MRSHRALVAMTLALILGGSGVMAVFFASPAQAHSSTVTVLDGQVLVRHGNGPFIPISDGDVIGPGDAVRTVAGSHGVLTFFDGSTVELEPDTELVVNELQASVSGDKIVELTQAFGRTWHVVSHLVGPRSKYEVTTGASTAAVRGTAFEVAVLADGRTRTSTIEGDVATSAQGAEVRVLPGQQTTVSQGSPPPAPQAAPPPAATIRITIDKTQNAIVTDANGRSVGVQNGLPVRYIPGSKVEVIGGKLVVTIPDVQLGVLSTFIKPDALPGGSSPGSVTVQTQVVLKDAGIVATSLTSRPVQNGTAKSAVVVTGSGLLLVPNSDAQNAPAPRIGRAPAAPTGILPIVTAPTIEPLFTSAPGIAEPTARSSALPVETKAVDVTTAAFLPFTPATTSTVATDPVNIGLITVTTPIAAIFTTAPAVTTTIDTSAVSSVITLAGSGALSAGTTNRITIPAPPAPEIRPVAPAPAPPAPPPVLVTPVLPAVAVFKDPPPPLAPAAPATPPAPPNNVRPTLPTTDPLPAAPVPAVPANPPGQVPAVNDPPLVQPPLNVVPLPAPVIVDPPKLPAAPQPPPPPPPNKDLIPAAPIPCTPTLLTPCR
jgi:hypothetical protein